MNIEMAYLLGLICGNGEIKRGLLETSISIEIPHKKLATEQNNDVRIYVKASIADIRAILEPLVGTGINFTQQDNRSIISFTKTNTDYLMREILRFVGNASSHENIRVCQEVFNFTRDQKTYLLKGFADVTGYIRRSNYFFEKHFHRVYLEVPHNWELVIDICNVLKDVDIPVQSIDWAHPNMRDGNLKKYNQGLPDFWKKEHQIKIWANEFEPVGFAVLHKKDALDLFARELIKEIEKKDKDVLSFTHKYYWDNQYIRKSKPAHPQENDLFIPVSIRDRHYDSWKEIAKDLGYRK
ncbi:hypothetical protein EZS27_001731 [termite gut metagenome]|uniref:DOD-type homing endonuclease domain-containing protein n=1 Tax=termite gut metagenome TaxID=433724 RepID=A0A5J4SY13_9ZZZZ